MLFEREATKSLNEPHRADSCSNIHPARKKGTTIIGIFQKKQSHNLSVEDISGKFQPKIYCAKKRAIQYGVYNV